MNRKRITTFTVHKRHLPHWEQPGAAYFATFSLHEPIRCDLTMENIAPIILDALAHYANKRYYLYDHTVMPDHVHLIVQPVASDGTVEPLGEILGDVKSYTAHKINERLERTGSLWLDESYDRLIRNEKEYGKFARYIFENPVKANLVENGEDWPWWRPGMDPPP